MKEKEFCKMSFICETCFIHKNYTTKMSLQELKKKIYLMNLKRLDFDGDKKRLKGFLNNVVNYDFCEYIQNLQKLEILNEKLNNL